MPYAFRLLLLVLILFASGKAFAAAPASMDEAFREGWDLLQEEKYDKALERFRGIPPAEYDLGDYVLCFTGFSLLGEGKRGEAAAVHDNLAAAFPRSPLAAYLAHALAYTSALDNDMAAARSWLAASAGKAAGNGSRAEEGYVAARLLESEGMLLKAAEAHLENFVASPAQEASLLSMGRLLAWRREGKWNEWGLPPAFYRKFAGGLSRASETGAAKGVYAEALLRFAPSEETYAVLLDYAELLRKLGDTAASRKLLDDAAAGAPPAFRNEVAFLKARVDWKAGRTKEAREAFLAIAQQGSVRPETAEKARYFAAWIVQDDGDIAAAAEEFGKLSAARDESIRQEAVFRNAFGVYLQKRYKEAIELFSRGEKTGFSSVERARHAYWKAVAAAESGDAGGGEKELAAVAGDPGAGPYALFASRRSGRNPYAMLDAPSSGETGSCSKEKENLWSLVRNAAWGEEDGARIRRMDKLVRLGIIEYAILEASGVKNASIRKAIGLPDGGATGLVRYLSGDLRGGIRETNDLPNDPATVEMIDRIQYPLAPEYLGDCDRKISGVDPLVLHSIIRQESRFQSNALSPAGAVGLMQLMPKTAAETARKERMSRPRRKDLLNPKRNVALGAAHFSRLLRDFKGDYLRAVAAYNAGESAVAKWWEAAKGDPALFLEGMTFRETRFYVRRVFLNVLQYYQIYRPTMYSSYFPIARAGSPQPPGVLSSPPTAGKDAAPPAPPAGSGGGPPAE